MSRFPSRFDDLGEGERSALRELARSAIDGSAPPDGADLAEARRRGVVHEDEDAFADGDAHAQALAESFLPDAISALESPSGLVDILDTLWRLGFRGRVRAPHPQVGPGARLLAALADEGHDVLSVLPALYTTATDQNGHPTRRAVDLPVAHALPLLSPTIGQALAVARAAAAVTNARTTGANFAGLAGVAHDLDVARGLLAALDVEDPLDAALIPHVVRGMALADLGVGLAQAAAYAEEPATAAIAALALGGIPVEPSTEEAGRVLDLLDQLADDHASEVAEALQHWAGRADPERTAEILTRLTAAEGGGDRAAHAMLMTNTTSIVALQAAASSPSLTIQGIDHLRGLLGPLAATDPETVLDVVEAYITARRYGTEGVPRLDEAFPDALRHLSDDDWGQRLPVWFGHSDPRLRRAAADVVRDPGHQGRSWRFHPEGLAALDAVDLLFLVRQALGLVRDGRALADLVLSVFDAPALPDVAEAYARRQLEDFVAYAYPGDTLDACEAVADDRLDAHAVAQTTAAMIRKTWADRAGIRPCKELGAPRIRTRAHEVGEARLQQAYLDAAREAHPSITDLLFTSVETRAGAGFGTVMPDGTLSVSPYQEMRIESHAPWGDMVDPLGMRLRRRQFIRAARGSDPELNATTP